MSEREELYYDFGPFRLDAAERLLLREGEVVPLTPKVFEMLLVLVENRGRVLERDALMQALWPDTFVEEGNLSSNVSILRKVLGEGRYIETLPRRGYRFTAEVEEVRAPASALVVRRQTRARLRVEETDDEGELNASRAGGELAATTSGVRTLAVLPFGVLGSSEADAYLGMGLADALITQLGNTGRIVVRPTSAVRKYADSALTSAEAGKELGVDAVLEGSIQQAGARLRLTVRMLSVRDGVPLWGESFRADFTDIFDVQDSIAEQVARALTLRLSGESRERLRKRYTDNVEAYQSYLRGRFFLNKRSVEGFRKAITHFNAAIELDPAYALAYAGLSDAYSLLSVWGEQPPREGFPRGRAAAERALEIDEELSEAHASLGYVLYFYAWDFARAEAEYRRAVELNPNYATAHNRYAQMLVTLERFDEAEAEMRTALELDPLSPMVNTAVGGPYLYRRQYDRAVEQFRKVLELEPDFVPAYFCLGIAHTQTGEFDEAIAAGRRAVELSGQHPLILTGLASFYAAAGRRDEALEIVEQLQSEGRPVLPYSLATVYARLADKDRAFAYLERAFEERNSHVVDINIDPDFDNLRTDPRFRDLARRIGLPEHPSRERH